ncbi:MAG: hypothetical protein IJZ30_02525 [Alphaproteobacteria bacterium]|nr:hypothetical protein [Alphaproteobacteria bacterium]
MRKVFFTLILNLFLINNCWADVDLARYEEECLSIIEKPVVKLRSSYGRLRYNFEKNNDFLYAETAKKFNEYGIDMFKEFKPMGLTKIKDALEVNMDVAKISVSHGYQCIYPETINIFLGYYLPTIYVSNELKKGTCLYDLTLRHEQTHMQIYIEALDYFLPKLKEMSKTLLDKKGVRIIDADSDAELQAKMLNNDYILLIEDYVNKWRKEVEKEQLKLDSIENYIIESKICEDIIYENEE